MTGVQHEAAPELVIHSWTPLWARGPGSCLGFASARTARVIRHLNSFAASLTFNGGVLLAGSQLTCP